MDKKIPLLSVYLFLLNVCFYNCLPTSVLLDAGSQDAATKKGKWIASFSISSLLAKPMLSLQLLTEATIN